MKFLVLLIMDIIIYIFITGSAFSAPVNSITGFSESEKLFRDLPFCIETTIRSDHQKSILREQTDQFPYVEPDGEERHYSKKRSSQNYSDLLSLEVGISLFNNAYIYAKTGTGRFRTELSVLDETVKGLFKEPDTYSITDDSLIMYGYGLAFNLYEKDLKLFFNKINTRMDIQYRKFFADVSNSGRNDLSYNLDLDEIQAGLLFVGSFKDNKIFVGPRISNITGGERLYLKKTGFYYADSIKSSKNMGWIFGISFFRNEFYSVTVQKRTGDEEGVSFEAKINF